MAAQKGSALLMKIGNAGSPETFTTIAGMRSTSISMNDEMVDILDIVLLVDMILNNIDDISGDINNDGTLNVIDIVQLVNIIIY